ncbi:hypothetical protein JM84_1618 [Dokdonia sp. Hel_I_63]|nr:hypothetical protein JM84_1618 [Dokdonia sp. Hel_I_63]
MERHGRLTRWIEVTGLMKHRYFIIVGLLLSFAFAKAQSSTKNYKIDSLQFKMYTRLFVNEQLQVDSVTVKKIFCDYCSESQMAVLREEAMRQSLVERYNPKYKKPGEHRLALYVRFSKRDFKNLNDNHE